MVASPVCSIVCRSISRPFSCNYHRRQIGKYIILSLLLCRCLWLCLCVCVLLHCNSFSLHFAVSLFSATIVTLPYPSPPHLSLLLLLLYLVNANQSSGALLTKASQTNGRAGKSKSKGKSKGKRRREGNLDVRAQFPCKRYPSIGAHNTTHSLTAATEQRALHLKWNCKAVFDFEETYTLQWLVHTAVHTRTIVQDCWRMRQWSGHWHTHWARQSPRQSIRDCKPLYGFLQTVLNHCIRKSKSESQSETLVNEECHQNFSWLAEYKVVVVAV